MPYRNAQLTSNPARARPRKGQWVWSGAIRRTSVALVVLLRGVNVGGHRTFRPTILAGQLKQLDTVNISAAGPLVIRGPVARTHRRARLRRTRPLAAGVGICRGRDDLALASE